MIRYVVQLQRSGIDLAPLVEWQENIAVGPFRTRTKAERRAATIRKLAETYEDPEGTTGEDNALDVFVSRLGPASSSAQDMLDVLYSSVDAWGDERP